MDKIIIFTLCALILVLTWRVLFLQRQLREEEQRGWEKRQKDHKAAEKELKKVRAELDAMRADRDKYRKIAYGLDRARLRLVDEKKGKRGAQE